MKMKWVKRIRNAWENTIHSYDPRSVLEASEFPWARNLEAHTREIQNELKRILLINDQIVNFQDVLPNQRALKQGADWKSFFLVALDKPVSEHQKICPLTSRALEDIPGLINAFFSILAPGTEIPAHRGPYAGILRCHLGLKIPNGDLAIRVNQQICHWQEGASLFFDDSFEHEVWNRSEESRAILFLDLERPLPGWMGIVNRAILLMMRFSPTVRRANKQIIDSQIASTSFEVLANARESTTP